MKEKYSVKKHLKTDSKMNVIASAAARLYSTKGYRETSMEDVAVSAKLSKGGMYHYFSSKEDILYFILSNFMDSLLEGFEQDLENIRDPEDKIRYIIRHHVEAYVAHMSVSYTHLRAHETVLDLVCRLLLEKKKKN